MNSQLQVTNSVELVIRCSVSELCLFCFREVIQKSIQLISRHFSRHSKTENSKLEKSFIELLFDSFQSHSGRSVLSRLSVSALPAFLFVGKELLSWTESLCHKSKLSGLLSGVFLSLCQPFELALVHPGGLNHCNQSLKLSVRLPLSHPC